jgi:hypothetical protein
MLTWLKLSQHHHSGRLRPHEHTSYLPLALILLLVAFPLTAYTVYAEHPPAQANSISLSGIMPGKAPTVAATIDSPTDQKHFTTTPITVAGTCPTNTLVELYKNDIFAGSTPCSEASVYSLDIDLMIGKNVLMARVYDALNQAGPDSNTRTVYYDALPAQAGALMSSTFGGAQLLLNTDAIFRGVFPGQTLSIPIDIIGGTQPFAINIQWGDSTNKIIPSSSASFTTSHIYSKAGTYQISIQASDSLGHVAFLTVAAVVNGQPSAATAATDTTTNSDAASKLLVLWPLYTAAAAVVTSFWLGERREKRVLRIRGQLLPS